MDIKNPDVALPPIDTDVNKNATEENLTEPPSDKEQSQKTDGKDLQKVKNSVDNEKNNSLNVVENVNVDNNPHLSKHKASSITENVENTSDSKTNKSFESINEDCLIKFDSELTEKTETSVVLPTLSAEEIRDVPNVDVRNTDNLSELVEKEINVFKETKLKSVNKSENNEEGIPSDKMLKDSISFDSTKSNILLPESTSIVTEKNDISLKEITTSESLNKKESPTELSKKSINVRTTHGLNKPDMMLEIPMHDFIEIDDADLSVKNNNKDDIEHEISNDDNEMSMDTETNLISKRIFDIVNELDSGSYNEKIVESNLGIPIQNEKKNDEKTIKKLEQIGSSDDILHLNEPLFSSSNEIIDKERKKIEISDVNKQDLNENAKNKIGEQELAEFDHNAVITTQINKIKTITESQNKNIKTIQTSAAELNQDEKVGNTNKTEESLEGSGNTTVEQTEITTNDVVNKTDDLSSDLNRKNDSRVRIEKDISMDIAYCGSSVQEMNTESQTESIETIQTSAAELNQDERVANTNKTEESLEGCGNTAVEQTKITINDDLVNKTDDLSSGLNLKNDSRVKIEKDISMDTEHCGSSVQEINTESQTESIETKQTSASELNQDKRVANTNKTEESLEGSGNTTVKQIQITTNDDLVNKIDDLSADINLKNDSRVSIEKDISMDTEDCGSSVQEMNTEPAETESNSETTLKACEGNIENITLKEEKECNGSILDNFQPSTSIDTMQLVPDTPEEMPEVSDSLGLLAESSRVTREEDDDQDDDDEDDDYFDHDDESSNQMTAEHSEDSNAQNSETDAPKESLTPGDDDGTFQFAICDVSEVRTGDLDILSIDKETDKIPDEATDNEQTDIQEKENSTSSTRSGSAKSADDPKKDLMLEQGSKTADTTSNDNISKKSPSKMMKLEISRPSHVLNIVDLQESSEDDDVQEIKKEVIKEEMTEDETTQELLNTVPESNMANVAFIAVKLGDESEQGGTKVEKQEEDEVCAAKEMARREEKQEDGVRNDDDDAQVDLSDDSTEKASEEQTENRNSGQPSINLEIFNLDTDDEDTSEAISTSIAPRKLTAVELEAARGSNKCINYVCPSGAGTENDPVRYVRADAACLAHYCARGNRQALVCVKCAQIVADRTQAIVDGIKNFTPLLQLAIEKDLDLVEISDSDSEDEGDNSTEVKETIGKEGADFVEKQLRAIMNETWVKYKMDARLKEAHEFIDEKVKNLELEEKEIDKLLAECQAETDRVRREIYSTFEQDRQELQPLSIIDTPGGLYYYFDESDAEAEKSGEENARLGKRRLSSSSVTPAPKRPAIPLGYTPLESETTTEQSQTASPLTSVTDDPNKSNEDKDVSVVQLTVESAPEDLPPPGEPERPPLKIGMQVYAMRNTFCSWLKGKILEVQPKVSSNNYSVCMVRFDHRIKNPCRVLTGCNIAYPEPPEVRMTIGTRVIAKFKNQNSRVDETFYSGIIAEVPNPVNKYRYLIFFDDGYAQYAKHADTRLVAESAVPVWDEVHALSREFVKNYLISYPERPMVRLHPGQKLKTEWNGKWWASKVLDVDASLVQVHFEEDNRTEWIYRGSTRLAPLFLEFQAAERHRARPLPRSKAQARTNMPYVEYIRSDEQAPNKAPEAQTQQQQQEEIRRQRTVAKKSTVAVPSQIQNNVPSIADTFSSRVVYYTPKNAVKPYKMVHHYCSPKCKRSDVLSLKDLRTYNPLAKPLLSGWERQIVRYKGMKEVMYRTPCGRRVRDVSELHRYLRLIRSDMSVDLFDFNPATHCLAEFVLNKFIVGKKDLSHGKELVPVPCVNYYDNSLPAFCLYNTERTPTAGVPLNLDPEFLCGCDCTDDCQDKTKCACWKMTLEGARTIGLDDPDVGYVYRRLPEPLPSGIYECNSRCKCKNTCLNRVAQHPLQLKLQVFKTLNRGWGIRALNDIPKGAFICVYAGNLLTDATANLDGLNEGDEYLAELDYIEVVEQMKEGYEDDIPEEDKTLDRKPNLRADSNDEEDYLTEEEKEPEERDDDFRAKIAGLDNMTFNKSLRARRKAKKDAEDASSEKEKEKEGNADEDCITISDDEEVREPSRFTAQTGMGANEFVSKYRSVRSYFGKDEACYIMDAKVQGNIGRYLNHSCSPNVFVQNVFVDTHDPRFPWVAFFALNHIRAGLELTWNYNYDVGSVPEKVLYCFCGAPNCRGRLL